MEAARRAESEIRAGQNRGPAARHPGRHQGPLQPARHRDGRRHEGAVRFHSRLRRDGRGEVGESGRGNPRQAGALRGRVRTLSPRSRGSRQSLERRAMERRVLERLGRRDGRRTQLRLHRHRHRRLDPLSRRRQRLRRAEADLRSREPARRVSARGLDGPCRPDGEDGRGRRHPLRCDRGTRSQRSDVAARAARGGPGRNWPVASGGSAWDSIAATATEQVEPETADAVIQALTELSKLGADGRERHNAGPHAGPPRLVRAVHQRSRESACADIPEPRR
jgi:hypothetical protein